MGWLLSERKGRKGWMEESLASVSAPPSFLVTVVGIVVALLIFSSYTSYKSQMERTKFGFNIFLVFLPLLLIVVANYLPRYGNFPARTKEEVADKAAEGEGTSPWGVALFLGLLLVLVSVGLICSPSDGLTGVLIIS